MTSAKPNPKIARLPVSAEPILRIQYGALPYRFTNTGYLTILLVTTRRSKRWIIPKGWPIKGMKPAKSAAREAFEEAGVLGRVGRKAIGSFIHDKQGEELADAVAHEVQVFPLRVDRELEVWPEVNQRELRWLICDEALTLVTNEGLRDLIRLATTQIAD